VSNSPLRKVGIKGVVKKIWQEKAGNNPPSRNFENGKLGIIDR
jgi:hypothetical protein